MNVRYFCMRKGATFKISIYNCFLNLIIKKYIQIDPTTKDLNEFFQNQGEIYYFHFNS